MAASNNPQAARNAPLVVPRPPPGHGLVARRYPRLSAPNNNNARPFSDSKKEAFDVGFLGQFLAGILAGLETRFLVFFPPERPTKSLILHGSHVPPRIANPGRMGGNGARLRAVCRWFCWRLFAVLGRNGRGCNSRWRGWGGAFSGAIHPRNVPRKRETRSDVRPFLPPHDVTDGGLRDGKPGCDVSLQHASTLKLSDRQYVGGLKFRLPLTLA